MQIYKLPVHNTSKGLEIKRNEIFFMEMLGFESSSKYNFFLLETKL